jgi:hypothetical protein
MSLFWPGPKLSGTQLTLGPGETFGPPEGFYYYKPGHSSLLQLYDGTSGIWRTAGDDAFAMRLVHFDGGKTVRLANQSGCAIGAVVTTAGSGYTSAPSVTASAGSSTWQAIIGGAVSTATTITAAGSGYNYAPVLWIDPPPQPGMPATAVATISSGSVSAVTIVDQGAGYLLPPNCTVIPDWRDIASGAAAAGAQVSLALTGSGTVTGVVCTNPGQPITSGTVPTLTFGSGSGAATVVMDWGVVSASVTTAGAGYTSAAAAVTMTGAGGFVTSTPAYLGGATSIGLVKYRPAIIDVTTNASGGLSALGAIIDPGHYQSVPTASITAAAQSPTTAGVLSLVMGGSNTTVFLMPAQQ